MFYVLSKTISIPSTFLVWLNKPGVSRIVISRTPIFHFSPLSILHAAIKQKSSNHTESPLPFTPTPPTSPPHPKKEANSLSNCPPRTIFCSPFTVIRITKALKWLRCDTVLPRLRANVPCNTSLRERVVNSLLLKLPPEGKNCAKWEAGCIRLFFFSWEKLRENQLKVFCLLCFFCLLSKNVLYTN